MIKSSQIFKLLSDETRLRLVLALAMNEYCVCELVGMLNIPQPKISKHLAMLKSESIVQSRREDKYIFYTLNDTFPMLSNIVETVLKHETENPIIIKDIKARETIQSQKESGLKIVCL